MEVIEAFFRVVASQTKHYIIPRDGNSRNAGEFGKEASKALLQQLDASGCGCFSPSLIVNNTITEDRVTPLADLREGVIRP